MPRARRVRSWVWAANATLVVLALGLALRPSAEAQSGGSSGGQLGAQSGPRIDRVRGTYTMITTKLAGGGAPGLVVIDASNQDMVILQWDTPRQQLVGVGYRSLRADLESLPSR